MLVNQGIKKRLAIFVAFGQKQSLIRPDKFIENYKANIFKIIELFRPGNQGINEGNKNRLAIFLRFDKNNPPLNYW